MKPVYFPEVNVEIAKDQPEYTTLPAHINADGLMVTCFELDEEEINNIIENKKIWVHVLTFKNPLQPFALIPVKNYFDSVMTDGTSYHLSNEKYVDNALGDLLKYEEE